MTRWHPVYYVNNGTGWRVRIADAILSDSVSTLGASFLSYGT